MNHTPTGNTAVGLIAGLLLALAGIFGGVSGLLFAVLLGALGAAIGAHRDGLLDLGAILRSRGRG
ncbi:MULTISPECIES: DUF2273 domain-containing protein [unclassified Rhodococcus (in: high G+C Gram-positive bacteria)]|uniref:DUF2273 domain-containing protein n=1 Tax=unclassified Rhodococcus (in: high G+C Gram-positive bacteria) TaxID=192944 RepID=UPI00146D3480|nr:DUF2273 domain-containing protein [Rhodococcus sp. (in: high G+C Gram-positive bacteria)]MBF0660415.1 DUF2273 domain-containing protein [Rhodococcus sp. (in: high G+C Gram-positive bacteria)]NMD94242.1 DUF2273 domain-containing protein [Rhodococcus sp. BL-253-APC-6A1W]NME77512.1 DUF2273 domain-containing protein [Rhodococcus sp. 105337]